MTRTSALYPVTFVVLCSLMTCCGVRPGSVRSLPRHHVDVVTSQRHFGESSAATPIDVTYLGSGGVVVAYGKAAVMIDPFFSHQRFGRIARSIFLGKNGTKTFKSDPKMVRAGLRRVHQLAGEGVDIYAILVAHSHYDHLMDVPAVARELRRPVPIYMNRTGSFITSGVVDSSLVHVLEHRMSTAEVVREPFVVKQNDSSAIRIYPILSGHNPHFRNIKFFSGEHTMAANELVSPFGRSRANLWLEGSTFSFLIDFVQDDQIQYRVFVQSSSCAPPGGLPPAELLNAHPVDLAFLGIVSYHFSPEYPCAQLKRLAPKEIIWVHWEDFFRKYTRSPKTVRGTDIPGFFELPCVRATKKAGKLLWPGTRITFGQ